MTAIAVAEGALHDPTQGRTLGRDRGEDPGLSASNELAVLPSETLKEGGVFATGQSQTWVERCTINDRATQEAQHASHCFLKLRARRALPGDLKAGKR